MKKKVGIIGATGFVGIELIRILLLHEKVKLIGISSNSSIGKKISDVYDNFIGVCDLEFESEDKVIESSDIIFAAVPHGLSEKLAEKTFEKNKILIDMGADFRLINEEDYKRFYENNYCNKILHDNSVYCIPELHRQKIINQKIIANPGCYPTSVTLALIPAIKADLVKKNSIIIDSKSGITGAGKNSNSKTHYISCNENFISYSIGRKHRHIPEIEQVINEFSKQEQEITFTTSLIPVNRGILSTIYFDLNEKISLKKLHELYIDFYKNEQFICILDIGKIANIRNVINSNYCHISLHLDEINNRIIIISCIDNMMKGAASQAIQNMNLILGIPENTGINAVARLF
ncbi:MAG: N-acetyl-gamma-glutamyl-phosphate reductase [Sarcina sp.]